MANTLLDTFEQTERILLHLLENDMGDEIWDLTGKVTQKGICYATGISRKHVSRPLEKLESEEFIEKDSGRPDGYRQRVLIYRMTQKGRSVAKKLRRNVLDRPSPIYENKTIGSSLDQKESLVKWLGKIRTDGTREENIQDRAKDDGEQLLRKLIKTAMRDGVLSDDERVLIDELVEQLSLSNQSLKAIIEEERIELEKISAGAESVYVEMLDKVWTDIGVGESTTALLDALAESLRLNPLNRKRLEVVTRKRHALMKTFNPSFQPYIDAIWIAMSDESISLEEDAILRSLRSSLGIGEDLNSQIIEAIRSLLSE
ncbi:MAG: hypothetical protein CMB56_003795 [Methanobacteriota archaeon]|nr:MAG: hypothetical protein CMB56_003795 [Euryarchaeota archaeon]